ncbi:repressor of the inhibitor of the protein kinase [Merluccius polli]|uniref:Repressor of the inhibitor of the protein kinase n=1 Tax=Merluccius polli TaxID=89951 RepID=A0AA47MCG0_MERPO|nr:repressor of the inhibitor of the protein kinase [Merluccius polli]
MFLVSRAQHGTPTERQRQHRKCQIWVQNSRKQDLLNRSPSYLSTNCKLCAEHFESSQFTNPSKNRFNWNAVPTLFSVPNPPQKITSKRIKTRQKRHTTDSPWSDSSRPHVQPACYCSIPGVFIWGICRNSSTKSTNKVRHTNSTNSCFEKGLLDTLRELRLLRTTSPKPAVSSNASSRGKEPRKRCARRQKRDNKLDSILLQRNTDRKFRDCCMFVFVETWLSVSVPDSAIQLPGLLAFRSDRDATLSGKTRGGGLCVYISTNWCSNAELVFKHCSPLVEFMTVRCRPFYMPSEFTAVYILAVYIPPSANATDALTELYQAITELQCAHPDCLFIVAGDFNHANLKKVLPKFKQYVDFPTRGNNVLDCVYCNITGAYRATPLPHLGQSDHSTVMLIPAYQPLVKRTKPIVKVTRSWPDGAISALQDCFDTTDWDMFKQANTTINTIDLEGYTSGVTGYISKCIDDVTTMKTITIRPNQRPWMNAEVRARLKARDAAYRSGEAGALKTARAELTRAIKTAKRSHSEKINNHFTNTKDSRHLWQGIQAITNYRPAPLACADDGSLPEELNQFYARFEAQNDTVPRKTTPPPIDQVLQLSTAERIVRTAERITGASLPSLPVIYSTQCLRKAASIVKDSTHPSHAVFSLLPSGRRYRSLNARTSRMGKSFFPQAIRLLNNPS